MENEDREPGPETPKVLMKISPTVLRQFTHAVATILPNVLVNEVMAQTNYIVNNTRKCYKRRLL